MKNTNTKSIVRTVLVALGFGFAASYSVAGVAQDFTEEMRKNALTQLRQSISQQHIVVMKPSVTRALVNPADLVKQFNGEITALFNTAVNGFVVSIPTADQGRFISSMSSNPNVKSVEPNQVFFAVDAVQNGATWGLDRINQRQLPLDSTYSYVSSGKGVNAYIVDTGISPHADFSGRVKTGYSAVFDLLGTLDCNSHGTHVAGTVGSETYGVAKDVNLIPVRVLGCFGFGSTVDIIKGVDWVTTNAQLPAVMNLSLGGALSPALDEAVMRAAGKGVVPVVAAGNDNVDACGYSPARTPVAITVGATNKNDARASFSNFGTCLDVFAPGQDIVSTSNVFDQTRTLSGTSMASPHVAGVVALHLQANPGATVEAISQAVANNSTMGVVKNTLTSPNRLVFSRPL